jgi:hypothetical protein
MRYLIAVGLAVALWAIACTRGPKGLSRPTYVATEKAVAALKRANEYRDAGAQLYEPRFLDVEKATDELVASATKPADTLVATIAGTCAIELKSYRGILDSYGALLAQNYRSPALAKFSIS